jgi:hypothetical protein
VLGMPENEAVDLLYSRSEYKREPKGNEHALNIVRRLGCLPLAIDRAGSYLSKRRDSLRLDMFLEHFERRKETIMTTAPGIWEYLGHSDESGKKVALNVFTTWELSYRPLESETDKGLEITYLLTLFAFFDHRSISADLFRSYCDSLRPPVIVPPWINQCINESGQWDADRFEDAVIVLCVSFLITGYVQGNDSCLRFSLHPLVQDWIQLRLTDAPRTDYSYQKKRQLDQL